MIRTTLVALFALGSFGAAFAAPLERHPRGNVQPIRPIHVGPMVLEADFGDSAFLLPAAGSLPGQEGTFFRSDVTLVNYASVAQIVAAIFLPEGIDGSSAPPVYLTLPANSAQTFDDFVGTTLGTQGLGAVLVLAVDSTHAFDPSGGIDGEERIWTNDPACAGTSSLAFPPVSAVDLANKFYAYAFGARQDSSFRANVGIVNLDDQHAHTWTVTVVGGALDGTSFTVTVPADSMNQVALPPGVYGEIGLAFLPETGGFYWSAYASSVDNASGDGWVSHAKQP